ncbi:unnamed protein product [Cuscuta epithymum]|uniref:Uncharacterized protein n=1 Tax=Cuscuta epithymum TaxID=186058 RepID=A0AAV0GJZ0_9ASTE|nr:unnamed protein product [Cuscuta epithymum]
MEDEVTHPLEFIEYHLQVAIFV